MTETPPPQTPEPDEPKRLTRSGSDAIIGGVSSGLGRYFGVDPVLFRVGFVAATLLSGVGAIAYLALVLFVKTDDDDAVAVPA